MKNLGFVVLWGVALVQSGNALFFCLRTNPCWGGKSPRLLAHWRVRLIDFPEYSAGRCWRFARLPWQPGRYCDPDCVRPPSLVDAKIRCSDFKYDSTQTKTITAVVSAVNTVTVTTSTTATVATTTELFTTTTTSTASTATNTVLQTTTAVITATSTQTALAITTTTTVYGAPVAKMMARVDDLVVQGNNPWGIPDYAWPACEDWNHYVDACKCFGIHPITVTKQPTTTTVTVTAPNAVTTTVSTFTTTTTNTIPVTATTSATFTAIVEDIASATVTSVVTATSTAAVITTATTPTVTSTQSCKATGVPFRITAQVSGDKTYLTDVGGALLQWFDLEGSENNPIFRSTFILDNDGLLELVPAGGPDIVQFIDVNTGTPTEQMFSVDQDIVEGTPGLVRVRGCVDATTNIVTLSAAGRSNILACNGFPFLSTSDGSERGRGCVTLMPLAEDPPV